MSAGSVNSPSTKRTGSSGSHAISADVMVSLNRKYLLLECRRNCRSVSGFECVHPKHFAVL